MKVDMVWMIIVLWVLQVKGDRINVTIAYADGTCRNINMSALDMALTYEEETLNFMINYPDIHHAVQPIDINGKIDTDFQGKRLKLKTAVFRHDVMVVESMFEISNLSNIECRRYAYKLINEICLLSTLEIPPITNNQLFFCLELSMKNFNQVVIRAVDLGCFWANSTRTNRDPNSRSPPLDKFIRYVATCSSSYVYPSVLMLMVSLVLYI